MWVPCSVAATTLPIWRWSRLHGWPSRFVTAVRPQHVQGPSISIDTACSSSLTATGLLRRLLLEGECSQGLITAALLTLDPATISMLTSGTGI